VKKLTFLLAVALPSLLAAQSDTAGALAAEVARAEALRRNDAVALAKVLSDDLRYVHSTGKLERKADAVGDLAKGITAFERFQTSQLHAAEIAPGVVVITGQIDQRKLSRGNWVDAVLLFHTVWRNESGTWRLVSLQTAAPPAPAAKRP
jgi:hypothetical protein